MHMTTDRIFGDKGHHILPVKMVIEEKQNVNLYKGGPKKKCENLHGAKQLPPAPATSIQVDIPKEKGHAMSFQRSRSEELLKQGW